MSRRRSGVVAAVLVLLAAGPASAGDLRLELEGGWLDMTGARDATRAVFGSSGGGVFGGGIGWQSSSHGLWARAGVRRLKRSGERVFAVDASSEVFRLGHPLEVKIVPVFGVAGWRFGGGRLVPYVGAGAGVTFYDETSTVAEITETTSLSKFSWRLLGGVELEAGRFRFAAELGWSSVRDALGAGGISERFGQTDAGGLSVVGRIAFVP